MTGKSEFAQNMRSCLRECLLYCGIGLQETVDGFRLINLACRKNALREFRKVNAVREILRFEAERTAGTVMSVLLPGL